MVHGKIGRASILEKLMIKAGSDMVLVKFKKDRKVQAKAALSYISAEQASIL